jgi:apolipoprotein N-acyltransferase
LLVRKIPAKAWALALLSSGLQILIFPKPSLFFLCWVAMVPLLYALLRGRGGEGELLDAEGRSLRPLTLWQGFVLAWVSGVVWYLGTCYWIYPVMNAYGNLGPAMAGFVALLFCLIMALHHGAFGLFVVLMARRSALGNRGPLFMAPFFWVAIEFFRDRVTGVPWQPLGGAQVDNIPFARIGEITGVYGLSFAVMLVNCAFTAALLLYGRRRLNLLISALAAAIALQMGVFAKPAPSPTNRQAVLLQPNIPVLGQSDWTPQFFDQTLSQLALLTIDANKHADGGPRLIVWPESPAPFWVGEPQFQHWMSAIAQNTGSFIVVGATAAAPTAGLAGQGSVFNSALVVDRNGRVAGRYDKIHLVPFGEYVPMQRWLFFANKLVREVGDYARGTKREPFDLDGLKAGVFICYESIFPDEVRQFAANGSQVLINISDDAWYGETGAPFQHLQMARMRAVENHRWILLDTVNGVTTSIDPYGRIVKQAQRNVRTTLVVPFSAETEVTFYTRFGDLFAWLCVVISLLVIFVRLRLRARIMIEAPSAP